MNTKQTLILWSFCIPVLYAAQISVVEEKAYELSPEQIGETMRRMDAASPEHSRGGIRFGYDYRTDEEVADIPIIKFWHLRKGFGIDPIAEQPQAIRDRGRISGEEVYAAILTSYGKQAFILYDKANERAAERAEAAADREARWGHPQGLLGLLLNHWKIVVPVAVASIGALLTVWAFVYPFMGHLANWLGEALFGKKPPVIVTYSTLEGKPDRPERAMFFNDETLADLQEEIAVEKACIAAGDVGFQGLILEGPPGTGKTFFSRQLATRAGFKIVEMDGASLAQLGEEEALQKLRELERYLAYHATPAKWSWWRPWTWRASWRKGTPVLLFVDEGDALFLKRGAGGGRDTKLVNTFLALVSKPDQPIKWVTTTNRVKVLDEAVVSRFGKVVRVPLPDVRTAKEAWAHYAAEAVDKYGVRFEGAPAEGALARLSQRDIEATAMAMAKTAKYRYEGLVTHEAMSKALHAARRKATIKVRRKKPKKKTKSWYKPWTWWQRG